MAPTSRWKRGRTLIIGIALIACVAASALALGSVAGARPARGAHVGSAKPPAKSATTRFHPRPGVTVTVSANPAHTASAAGAGTNSAPAIPSGPSIAWRPGSGQVDNAALMLQSPTTLDKSDPPSAWSTVTLYYLNTGSTVWSGYQGYQLRCRSTCWSGWYIDNQDFTTLHGLSHTFVGHWSPQPCCFYHQVFTSVWQLWSPTTGYFGSQAKITVVEAGWAPSLLEASPACASGDGAQWAREGTAGTVTCGASGLELAQGGADGAALSLTSTPPQYGYDYGNYYLTFHVHFDNSSATTFAGAILSTATSGNGGFQTVFLVSPAGYYCEAELLKYCSAAAAFPLPPSSDYDVTVEVYGNGSGFVATLNGSGPEGGLGGGGATGLMEITAPGSTDAAYFTNYQMYQYE